MSLRDDQRITATVYYAARTLAQARTEPASPRRIATALAAGVRPISLDLASFSAVAATWLLVVEGGAVTWEAWKQLFMVGLSQVQQSTLDMDALANASAPLLRMLVTPAVVVLLVTLLGAAAQGALSLRSSVRVSVAPTRTWRTLWLVVKACVITMAFASIANTAMRAVVASPSGDLGYAVRVLTEMADLAASRFGVALALLVIADLIVERVLWRHSLQMTRDELRRELRDTEGDPNVRNEGQRRQRSVKLGA